MEQAGQSEQDQDQANDILLKVKLTTYMLLLQVDIYKGGIDD